MSKKRCQKLWFGSKAEARRRRKRSSIKCRLEIYKCPNCDGWHFTTKDKYKKTDKLFDAYR